jgi:DedD protein
MDQSLKARLIGATVLVILAVLLIPELLSGRKSVTSPAQEAPAVDRRTITIDIGKSGGTMTAPAASRPQPSPVEAPTSAGPTPGHSPVAQGDTAAAGQAAGDQREAAGGPAKVTAAAEQNVPKAAETPGSPSPPPAARTAPEAGGGGSGTYFVQVGAFSSAESARKLVAQLSADGFQVRVSPVSRGGKTLHRVRVGPASSRTDAQQLAERLKARGLPASLVTSE